MKHLIKRTLVAIITVTLLIPVAASAHEGHDHGVTDGPDTTESLAEKTDRYKKDLQATLEDQKAKRTAAIQDKRAEIGQKLDANKKKICERHQTKINKIIDTMNERRQSAFDRIAKVSDAVQAYYTKQNLSLDGYDDVIAKVTAAKSAAQSAMQGQQSATMLDCNGEQPHADMTAFKEKRSSSIDAIKLYRSAVKELLSATKEATKAARMTTAEGGQQ